MREWVCLNGVLMPADEARVSVFDSGFMQGIGLFETMRAYNGKVLRLDRHLDRLANSAVVLGWTVTPDTEELADNVSQVLSATRALDARVRLTVTTGSLHATASDVPGLTVVVTASPGEKYPDEYYAKGVTVLVSNFRQSGADPTVGHKTTSYFARLASLRAAHAQAAFEALWLTPDGHLAEAAISNVFVVHDQQLLTPPLDTPVLPGITRATVIELAVALDIPVRETPLTLEDVRAADEVFLTNSMMEVMPVVRVEREPISDEKPGDVTRELAVAYGHLIDRECSGE
ncbi:MAG: aminotransferase class IV family protein [Phycisphaerae bacterium]|nr:aminotransferase class IV family protein [Phycisphaerae bacterium]